MRPTSPQRPPTSGARRRDPGSTGEASCPVNLPLAPPRASYGRIRLVGRASWPTGSARVISRRRALKRCASTDRRPRYVLLVRNAVACRRTLYHREHELRPSQRREAASGRTTEIGSSLTRHPVAELSSLLHDPRRRLRRIRNDLPTRVIDHSRRRIVAAAALPTLGTRDSSRGNHLAGFSPLVTTGVAPPSQDFSTGQFIPRRDHEKPPSSTEAPFESRVERPAARAWQSIRPTPLPARAASVQRRPQPVATTTRSAPSQPLPPHRLAGAGGLDQPVIPTGHLARHRAPHGRRSAARPVGTRRRRPRRRVSGLIDTERMITVYNPRPIWVSTASWLRRGGDRRRGCTACAPARTLLRGIVNGVMATPCYR